LLILTLPQLGIAQSDEGAGLTGSAADLSEQGQRLLEVVDSLPEDEDPPDQFHFELTFSWALPPLPHGPDLLRLAIDLAGVGGIDLPLEVSAIDSFASATDAPDRRLSILARYPVSLARILGGEELLCEVFDRSLAVSRFLLDAAPGWLDG